MSAPYLIEVRTGGELKSRMRDIIYDVADRFDVRGVADPRPVPHITLYGPYDTNQGQKVKETLVELYAQYDVVPYVVDGFGHFRENDVIYAKVVPSPELQSLRREIRSRLQPYTYNERAHDAEDFYDFHITIAFKDVGRKFDDIWQYVNDAYDPYHEEYALRLSSIRRREMMWEYDLLQNRILEPSEATSKASWNRTNEILAERSSPQDHANLDRKPWLGRRLLRRILTFVRDLR